MAIASCATCPRPSTPAPRPWVQLENKCELKNEIVCCEPDAFHRAGLETIDLARRLDLTTADLQAQRQLEATAVRDVRDCRDALDSPWRSPWLWALIGGAAGVGIGVWVGLANR